ncbi:MAG: hypothetical protein L6Q35_00645 [Phycisphaerales bacterium]|nr:hypothetical protein [Phycisphaerales bacterium]
MSASIGKLQIDFVANLAGFVSAVNKATSKVDQFAKATTERLRKVDAGLQQLGSKMTLKVTAPLLALAAVSVKAADQNKKFADTLERVGLQAQAAMKPLGRVLIDMFEQARPTIERGIALINGLALEFERLEPQTKRMIVMAGAIAAAIGPALLALSALGTIAKGVASAFALATTATQAFVGVLPALTKGLLAVGAAWGGWNIGGWLYDNFKPVQVFLAVAINWLEEAFEKVRFVGELAFESITLAFKKMVEAIAADSTLTNLAATAAELTGNVGTGQALRALGSTGVTPTESFADMAQRVTRAHAENMRLIGESLAVQLGDINREFDGQGLAKDNAGEDFVQRFTQQISGAGTAVDDFIGKIQEVVQKAEDLGSAAGSPIVQTEKDLKRASEAAKQLESDLEKAIQFRFEAYPKEKLRADIANLEALRDRLRTVAPGILDDATVQKLSDQWAKALDKLDKKTQETFGDKLNGAIEDFSKNMSDAFADLVVDGEASFEQLAKSFGKMLVSMFAQQMAFQPLMAGIGAAIGMPFGAGSGSTTVPATGKAMGGAFVRGSEVAPFARGGVVRGRTYFGMRGGLGMMGEAGPEAIMPLERIGNKLGINAAGAGTTVIVENHTGAPAEVEKSRGPDGRELTRVVVGVVKRAITAGDLDKDMRQNFGVRRQAR